MIIGKNGTHVNEMKQRLIDLGLDLKSINVVDSGVHCCDCSQKFIRKKKEIIAEQKRFISQTKTLANLQKSWVLSGDRSKESEKN